MNKILASLLPATLIFLGCNIPYLQVSKKNADKFCGCYEDAAKHAYDMDLWLEKHYDRMDNESNQKKWAELEVDFGEFMEEAEDCYTDFTREQGGLYKEREADYNLINLTCPEISYNIGFYSDFNIGFYSDFSPVKLSACDCVSEATSMIEGMESAEDLESFEEKLEEAHPECADIDEKEVEENCKDEMAEMMSAMMSKAMELGGM